MRGKRHNFNKFAQRKRDRRERERNPGAIAPSDVRKNYEDIVRENLAFEQYYKEQNICPAEEWEIFMNTLRQNLPTAFRITGSKGEANALLEIVKSQYFADIANNKLESADGSQTADIKPFCLPWYPGGLAWQLLLSRTDIRRSPPLFKLHNFLVAETAAGGVSRQEAVSMVPPVVLDVKPHHKVLDMCAAPGSKTAQLIEFLHAEEGVMPSGFVIANDIDNNRCYMLVHQAKRLNSPCIVITNHDSAFMPNMVIDDDQRPLKFDRILCDVPCSGDATLRKNPDIWLKWSTGNGNNLHGVQYRILKRGTELLAVGGRIVYSTCSFNPLENEAVIHRMLKEADGALELVDVAHKLPGLVHSKGMSYWKPAAKDLSFYGSYDDVPERWQTVVRPQMFPPKPDEVEKYKLNKCIRILPHQQDTGGFFVAVLEKKFPLPWESQEVKANIKQTTESTSVEPPRESPKCSQPQRKKQRLGGYREDPFVFFSGSTEDVFPSIKEFYKLSENFDPKCLLTRCHFGKKKNVYLVSPTVRDLVTGNAHNIKIINTGVKTFVRCDNKKMTCAFRLSQEGLQSVVQYVGEERKVKITKTDLIIVLEKNDPSNPPDLSLFSEETQKRLSDFPVGSCVILYEDKERDLVLELVGWRGVRSFRAYTANPDTVHMLRILGADISKYDVNKFQKADSAGAENLEISKTADDASEAADADISESASETASEDTSNENGGT